MPSDENWRKNLGFWPPSVTKSGRIQHEYPNGGMVELRFFVVREYQKEIENRIFRGYSLGRSQGSSDL